MRPCVCFRPCKRKGSHVSSRAPSNWPPLVSFVIDIKRSSGRAHLETVTRPHLTPRASTVHRLRHKTMGPRFNGPEKWWAGRRSSDGHDREEIEVLLLVSSSEI
ncbi:hypothetical protein JTE90_017902 [Oedothorax gibbosus]|uniref:Uncharacterized protein n=1 Tax=Oedothorax gibbosus TaxID=931172 RepID=A0AAV6VFV1_9ARAC|nr:hypothetical protein JTE90_017902 [Oedothorax gibbosus]